MRSLWTLLALLWLTACSTDEDSAAVETESDPMSPPPSESTVELGETVIESTDEGSLRALARDPEALREAMQDPERRQALREQMQAMREKRRAEMDVDAEARRAAMRERAERFRDRREAAGGEGGSARGPTSARFWEDAALVEALALSEDQVSGLTAAHRQLGLAGRESRQTLARVSSDLTEALAETDRERLRMLVQARREAMASRAEAEAEWMSTLLSTLSDEQLRQLADDYPALVRRLASPN